MAASAGGTSGSRPGSRTVEDLLERAEEWRVRTNLTMQGMFEFLQLDGVCDRSTFSRIWNRRIKSGRTADVVMERIGACVGRHACSVQMVEPPASTRHHPDFPWFSDHLETVRFCRDTAPTEVALARIPSLFSQARHGPDEFRTKMCVNVLGASAVLFDRPDYQDAPARLSERIIEGVPEVIAAIDAQESGGLKLACGKSYGGVTLLLAGLPACRRALIEQGAELVLAAATTPHESRHGLWKNALDNIEALAREEIPGHLEWATRLHAAMAEHAGADSLRNALDVIEIPRLQAAWQALGLASGGARS